MADQTIKCPKCGAKIPLTEALTSPIEARLRAEVEAEARKKDLELDKERQELTKRSKDLEARERAADERVTERVKAEVKKIAEQEREKILVEQAGQTKALRDEIEEKSQKLKEAQQQELELRKERRKLEEDKEAFELEAARKMDEERKQIAEEATRKATEEQHLKMREKEDLIKGMQKQIEVLKRKAEVGSQEAQGEALEGSLQDALEQSFPSDRFAEVKKGQRGADIIQVVRNSAGKECGSILWESKNTKDFSNAWIGKLRKDQQQAGADIGVIMSVALPKEVESFGRYEDLWVTDYRSAVGLATALRQTLISVAREKTVTAGQDTMKDVIYSYVTGPEFAMRVKMIANAYAQMQNDLDSEKRSMTRIWAKREKQIACVLENIGRMRGEIEGLVGGQKTLPAVDVLSLDTIASEEDA